MAGYIGSKAVSVNTTSATISDDLAVGDDLTVTDDATIGGTLGVTGVVTANAGVVVDTMTLDAATLTATGDFTVDSAGDIVLDAAGEDIKFFVGGSAKGRFTHSSGDFVIQADTTDKDMIFKGDDGGAAITALTLDMSDLGKAIFNSGLSIAANDMQNVAAASIYHDSSNRLRYSGGTAGHLFADDANSTVHLRIDATGAVTMPLQPAFSARPTDTQTNIGVATTTVKFHTQMFDVNADFRPSTGDGQGSDENNFVALFTAPVTGKYQLNMSLRLENIDSAATYYQLAIVTSNRNYRYIFDPDFGQDNAFFTPSISVLADMDTGDTAHVTIAQSSGTAQTDIHSESAFNGVLVA